MFSLNEKVVYPGHGVAKINRLVEKNVSGSMTQFFELTFLNKDMTILVPVNNLTAVGVRRLSSTKNITDIYRILSEPLKKNSPEITASNWNKRNKEYQGKLRSGDLNEICKIYRDLKHIATHKELSFGEKNLLSQTESFLAQEISLVNNVAEEKAIERLRALFNNLSRGMIDHKTM